MNQGAIATGNRLIRFAARRTAPLKNLPGLRRDEVGARALPARKMRLSGRFETGVTWKTHWVGFLMGVFRENAKNL